jgi:two-component system sensor histidine kinase RegB
LLRLISNGLDASREDATPVEVTAAIRDSSIAFEVRDVGVGMPPEVLERAAEPFFTTKEPGAGMGIGLFLVNTFALSRGGELRLESEPGRGTTVGLILPAVDGSAKVGASA